MPNQETASCLWQPLNGRGLRRIPRPNVRTHNREKGGEFKVCTVNVGTLIGKSREVVEMLARRKVGVCCIQETRYKNKSCTVIGSNNENYKLWYSGDQAGEHGVGIMVKHELADDVIEVVSYDSRCMKIKMVIGRKVVQVFSVYARQIGRPAQEKEDFWEKRKDEIVRIPQSEGLIVGGDINAHIGPDRDGFEEIMGCNGYRERNGEGQTVLDLCKNHELKILNTYFKKSREKLINYNSGGCEIQIDLLLMRKSEDVTVVNCNVIPGEACVTQHRMVRAELVVKNIKRRKWKGHKRI